MVARYPYLNMIYRMLNIVPPSDIFCAKVTPDRQSPRMKAKYIRDISRGHPEKKQLDVNHFITPLFTPATKLPKPPFL
ncbi:hypothetical protein CKQ53_11595 [Lonsdalea britannica]|uniref:Uncharacterized protein n=1 Tax=Lonsdalea britannica TaxID=1082704 RepID=A0AAD0SH36_9GAMM|nr:hypothetical protein CKQ53_11595 [Lonsdalea britannica]